jgi:two-component system response regulator YesN
MRILHLTRSGDWDNIKALADELFAANFVRRKLAPTTERMFLYLFWGMVTNVQLHCGVAAEEVNSETEKMLAGVEAGQSPRLLYGMMTEAIRRQCDAARFRKKSHNTELYESMIRCIHDEYSRVELNLDYVADRFQMSGKYLSHFFKEQSGVNFVDYLMQLRMEQARTLLRTTSLTIQDISVRTGYSSSNVFCRAFKRSHGMSPMAFRND